MDEKRFADLESRLASLETRNRLLSFLCASLIVGATVVACGRSSGSGAGTFKANKIMLVDGAGQTRGMLFADQQGAVISLDDSNGKTRTTLSAGKDRSGLELFNEGGKVKAAITIEPEGTSIGLADDGGRMRTTIGSFKDDTWMAFLDPKGQVTYSIPPAK